MLPESGAKDEVYKALAMLNAFASVGAQRFDVTFTDLDGKKPEKGGFLANRHINGLRSILGYMLAKVTAEQKNFIVRPHRSPRAEIIQLDDLDAQKARRFEHLAFLTIQTSPGSFQAWVAVTDPEPDFARRLRKGAGADPSASGATRIAGSRNFKRKYGPGPDTAIPIGGHFYPMVEITGSNTGLAVTRAELEAAGLVAGKTPPRAAPIASDRRREQTAWPSYQVTLSRAQPSHGDPNRPDISGVDFVWCKTAIRWGHAVEATAKMLLQHSPKAQEPGEGERYATRTAWKAAEAVEQDRSRSR